MVSAVKDTNRCPLHAVVLKPGVPDMLGGPAWTSSCFRTLVTAGFCLGLSFLRPPAHQVLTNNVPLR